MTTVKSEVIAMIQQMPEDIDVPDIMAELYFKQKVDAGLKELDDGNGIPHNEVKGRLNKWLK
jgi:predicted transcriptional regulator